MEGTGEKLSKMILKMELNSNRRIHFRAIRHLYKIDFRNLAKMVSCGRKVVKKLHSYIALT